MEALGFLTSPSLVQALEATPEQLPEEDRERRAPSWLPPQDRRCGSSGLTRSYVVCIYIYIGMCIYIYMCV